MPDPKKKDAPLFPVNTLDATKLADQEDDGRRFVVLHEGLGPHAKGAELSVKDFGPGADLNRLATLGAIMEVPKEELEAREKAEAEAEAQAVKDAEKVIADARADDKHGLFAPGGTGDVEPAAHPKAPEAPKPSEPAKTGDAPKK